LLHCLSITSSKAPLQRNHNKPPSPNFEFISLERGAEPMLGECKKYFYIFKRNATKNATGNFNYKRKNPR
jgi:hypothetical protein